MTYTSDLQLRAMGILPLRDIPNKEGFVFIGVRRDHSEAECVVELDNDAMHYVSGVTYAELIGWKHPK